MSLSNNLIELFEQLTIVPLTQIAANIENFHDLIKLSFKSQKWRAAIGSRKIDKTELRLRINENDSELLLSNYPWGLKRYKKVLNLVKKNSNDGRTDNVIRVSDHCYHQNLIDTLYFLGTELSSIFLSRVEIVDAKWLDLSDLLKIDVYRATFGANRLKTRDLRVFLFHWFNGISCRHAQHWMFQMSKEQVEELDMNEILKSFDPKLWDPETRNRKFLAYDSEGICLPIDVTNGYDIRHPNGRLATIYLDPDTYILHFCVWGDEFGMGITEWAFLELLVSANKQLARDDLEPKERLKCKEERRKHLQSLRNLRNDQNLDFTDVVYRRPFRRSDQ